MRKVSYEHTYDVYKLKLKIEVLKCNWGISKIQNQNIKTLWIQWPKGLCCTDEHSHVR